jgi:hypothetical protein
MSGKESQEDEQKKADGELSETELEQAAAGKRTSDSPQSAKNRACFRMLEEDFLFKRLERRGWRR